MKNVRSSQPCISMNFFSKAQGLPCEYRSVSSCNSCKSKTFYSVKLSNNAFFVLYRFLIKYGVIISKRLHMVEWG